MGKKGRKRGKETYGSKEEGPFRGNTGRQGFKEQVLTEMVSVFFEERGRVFDRVL